MIRMSVVEGTAWCQVFCAAVGLALVEVERPSVEFPLVALVELRGGGGEVIPRCGWRDSRATRRMYSAGFSVLLRNNGWADVEDTGTGGRRGYWNAQFPCLGVCGLPNTLISRPRMDSVLDEASRYWTSPHCKSLFRCHAYGGAHKSLCLRWQDG